ncbi:hypothetical protein [Acetobacterium bakii]|uniref:Uncharacterized protein n=1 Tax=Acetobacterium bakii TaxID=52689 RepID=A0A0L6TZT5_9FIRM|nr:hypothetical protein [Acetobacterium bakii]KNZ41080.1 hypothetical protein AKG39_14070 [Acetobacterium bakii]
MSKLDDLNDLELKKKLENLVEELKDIENERSFLFKQSGMHVSSSKIAAQMADFDTEAQTVTERIAECIEEIKHRGL